MNYQDVLERTYLNHQDGGRCRRESRDIIAGEIAEMIPRVTAEEVIAELLFNRAERDFWAEQDTDEGAAEALASTIVQVAERKFLATASREMKDHYNACPNVSWVGGLMPA